MPTPSQRDVATGAFLAELSRWVVVELTQEVVPRAGVGDALLLASAVVLQSRLAGPIDEFVAAGQRLLEAARAERMTVTATGRPTARPPTPGTPP